MQLLIVFYITHPKSERANPMLTCMAALLCGMRPTAVPSPGHKIELIGAAFLSVAVAL